MSFFYFHFLSCPLLHIIIFCCSGVITGLLFTACCSHAINCKWCTETRTTRIYWSLLLFIYFTMLQWTHIYLPPWRHTKVKFTLKGLFSLHSLQYPATVFSVAVCFSISSFLSINQRTKISIWDSFQGVSRDGRFNCLHTKLKKVRRVEVSSAVWVKQSLLYLELMKLEAFSCQIDQIESLTCLNSNADWCSGLLTWQHWALIRSQKSCWRRFAWTLHPRCTDQSRHMKNDVKGASIKDTVWKEEKINTIKVFFKLLYCYRVVTVCLDLFQSFNINNNLIYICFIKLNILF